MLTNFLKPINVQTRLKLIWGFLQSSETASCEKNGALFAWDHSLSKVYVDPSSACVKVSRTFEVGSRGTRLCLRKSLSDEPESKRDRSCVTLPMTSPPCWACQQTLFFFGVGLGGIGKSAANGDYVTYQPNTIKLENTGFTHTSGKLTQWPEFNGVCCEVKR